MEPISDTEAMRRAIALARSRMGYTWPNPAVGCVIVKGGAIIGEAATANGGRPHAEEQAVPAAGEATRGATAYVTLEPCGARSSGRTSCASHLVEAGVSRVVVACLDPSPFASGRGIARLEAAGLSVETGLLAEEALSLCAGFVHRLQTGRPLLEVSALGEGYDGRFTAALGADHEAELLRLGEAGYTRLHVLPGALAEALREKRLLA